MRKQPLLLSLLLAVGSLLATTAFTAEAANREPVRQKSSKAKKARPQAKPAQRPRPSTKKAARKAGNKQARKPVEPAVAATPLTDTRTRITRPGDYRFAIRHDGRVRTYRVHVPSGYAGTVAAPLLVALDGSPADRHGTDGFYGLVRESDRQGAVSVFPDRAGGDVRFVEAIVTNVFRQMTIDRDRIYAAGIGDGGRTAYRLACELPHVFRAVASVGGADTTPACTAGKPTSVLHFHANNDPGIASARHTVATWAQRNGCMETPQRVLEKAGAYCEAWSYCRGQAEVQLCVTETGGQSWPGAAPAGKRGPNSPSQAIAATPAIWGFFSQH